MIDTRPLTIQVVRYSFSDVVNGVDLNERKLLLRQVHKQRAIYSARALRRLVTAEYFPIRKELNKFLERKRSALHRNMALTLMLTVEEVSNGVGHLFDAPPNEFTASELFEVLSADPWYLDNSDPNDVSKRLHDFERSHETGLLFASKGNVSLRLKSDRSDKKNYRLVFDKGSDGEARRIDMIFVVSFHDIDELTKTFETKDGFRLIDDLKRSNAKIFHIKSRQESPTIDLYVVSGDSVVCKKFYHEDGDTRLLSEKSVEPRVISEILNV